MIWKKTWFSYVLWALYSVVVSVAFASGLLLYVPSGKTPYVAVGVVCLYFLLMAFTFFFLQMLLQNLGKRKLKKKVAAFLEAVLLLAVLCVFLVIQVQSISKVDVQALVETEYLSKSFVQGGMAVSKAEYGAEWFYLHLLRGVFLFAGNHAKAALWLQFVLQVAGSFFFCAGIRKLSGRISGVLCFAGLMLIPVYASERNVLTPLWLEFFLFAVGFYGAAFFLRRRRDLENAKDRGKGAKQFDYLGPFFLGIYISGVIYGDLSGVLLVCLGLSVLWSLPVRNAAHQGYPVRTIQAFSLLGGCIAGLFLLFWGSPCSLKEWWSVYAIQAGKGFHLNFNGGETLSFVCLTGCLFWGIFRFFYEKEEDSLSGMFFFFLGMAGLGIAGLTMPRTQELWLLLLLTVCASVSLERSLTRVGIAAEIQRRDDDCGEPEPKEEESGEVQQKEIETQTARQEEMESEAAQQAEAEAEEKKQEEKPEIKFLENPLPGPKKHVPRKLDFELSDEQIMERSGLDYDVKISDDDDFDL